MGKISIEKQISKKRKELQELINKNKKDTPKNKENKNSIEYSFKELIETLKKNNKHQQKNNEFLNILIKSIKSLKKRENTKLLTY